VPGLLRAGRSRPKSGHHYDQRENHAIHTVSFDCGGSSLRPHPAESAP
jgi:hypothetical protein